jgi:hypothetical protein
VASRGDLVWISDPKGSRPAVVLEVCGSRLFVMVGTGTNRIDLSPHCIPKNSRDGRVLGLSKDTYFPAVNARSIDPSAIDRRAGGASTRLVAALFEILDRDGVPLPTAPSAPPPAKRIPSPLGTPALALPAEPVHAVAPVQEPPSE